MFKDIDFMYTSNHNEIIRFVFPVRMYSFVKFIKLSNNRFDFCEIVCVNVIKEYF